MRLTRHLRAAFCALLFGVATAAGSTGSLTATPGILRIALYQDFAPYSANGRGSDVDLALALAERLGLRPELVWFQADEDMNDDLRNAVWKGHYLGLRPADLMLHVPVDPALQRANPKVRIFGAYYLEELALARRKELPAVSAPGAWEAYVAQPEWRLGVEWHTPADGHLMQVLGGRLRAQIAHFSHADKAVAALRGGDLGVVLAPRGTLQAALADDARFVIQTYRLPPPAVDRWRVGMAVKAESDALQAAIEAALDVMRRDGSLQRLLARHHLDALVTQP